MATFIKGDPIENATHYELAEKLSDGTYALLDTKAEINFEVSAMSFSGGEHTLVVKAKASGYEDSDYSNEVVYTVEANNDNVVFDFDFATNTIDDYALSEIFIVPDGSNTSTIEYDSTYGMNLKSNLPYGLSLVNPIDASRPWTLEFTANMVTPTVLAGNRRALITGGDDLVPFVVINSSGDQTKLGFQISSGAHTWIGSGNLIYDQEVSYKIVHDGANTTTVYQNGIELGKSTANWTGKQFGTILGVIKGKSTAYTWQDVESGKKSYLHKIKFYYN